jgi:hypothetical protein
MKKKKRRDVNDIRIGEDEWIEFGKLRGELSAAENVDLILGPVIPFFEQIETGCVADCCGITAFELTPQHIEVAASNYDHVERQALAAKFEAVMAEIESLGADVVSSRRLNQLFRKSVFLLVLDHVRKTVAKSS